MNGPEKKSDQQLSPGKTKRRMDSWKLWRLSVGYLLARISGTQRNSQERPRESCQRLMEKKRQAVGIILRALQNILRKVAQEGFNHNVGIATHSIS